MEKLSLNPIFLGFLQKGRFEVIKRLGPALVKSIKSQFLECFGVDFLGQEEKFFLITKGSGAHFGDDVIKFKEKLGNL